MPLKWKLYYISNLFNALYQAAWVCFLLYMLIHDHNSFTDIWQMSLIDICLMIISLKSLLSLKMVSLYNNNRLYKKSERTIIIIGYCFTAILFILTTIASVYFLYNLTAHPMYTRGFRALDTIPYVVLVSFFTMLYTLIFDFPILKAIRKQHSFSIESIGADIGDTQS